MKGFLIKKAFFDGWDNMISLIVCNLVYVALLCAFISLGSVFNSMIAFTLINVVMVIVVTLARAVMTQAAFNWSNYQGDTMAAVREGFRKNMRHGLFLSVVEVIMFLLSIVVLPFYFSMGTFGFVIGAILIGIQIMTAIALPYYYPLMDLLPGDRPTKTFKKCFIIVADNMGFSLFFALYQIVMIAISIFTLGLVPGFQGLELARQDAMKLLMKKYDWLEAEEGADRKHVPWDDILFEEKEKVGPRGFKGMIFPWKD